MLAGYVPEERKADIDIISVLADKVPFGILILMELSKWNSWLLLKIMNEQTSYVVVSS